VGDLGYGGYVDPASLVADSRQCQMGCAGWQESPSRRCANRSGRSPVKSRGRRDVVNNPERGRVARAITSLHCSISARVCRLTIGSRGPGGHVDAPVARARTPGRTVGVQASSFTRNGRRASQRRPDRRACRRAASARGCAAAVECFRGSGQRRGSSGPDRPLAPTSGQAPRAWTSAASAPEGRFG
jgi:hypothetical protein